MRGPWRRFKNGYMNLSLQTKFTIALMSIVILPAFLTVFLFYGRLYNMVVSNTIRQEQDASAKTAPLIERTMDTVLSTTRNITGQSRSGGTNIAVYNTHRRLQILYGNDYGLSYSSKPDEGTEVEIRFPARREE